MFRDTLLSNMIQQHGSEDISKGKKKIFFLWIWRGRNGTKKLHWLNSWLIEALKWNKKSIRHLSPSSLHHPGSKDFLENISKRGANETNFWDPVTASYSCGGTQKDWQVFALFQMDCFSFCLSDVMGSLPKKKRQKTFYAWFFYIALVLFCYMFHASKRICICCESLLWNNLSFKSCKSQTGRWASWMWMLQIGKI